MDSKYDIIRNNDFFKFVNEESFSKIRFKEKQKEK